MAHIAVDFFAKGGGATGIGIETTSGNIVLVKDGVIVGRWTGTGLDQQQPGEARGNLMAYGAAGWDNLVAKTAGQLVAGDGTDVKSLAVAGDVTFSAPGGVLTSAIGADKVLDAMILSEIVKNLGNQSVAFLDSVGVGSDTETVTVGTRVYELDTHSGAGSITPGRVRVDVSGGSTVKARGTLNLNSQPLNGETVTIGGKVYTFEDALTNVDGHVHISHTSASLTIDNLIAAIMLGNGETTPGAGTDYAAATTIHPTVTAAVGAGDTMIVSAKAGGVGGNAIATLDGLSDVLSVWDAGTLGTTTAGVSPTAGEVATALMTAINADASRVMDARDVGWGTVLLVTKAAGASLPSLAEASANIVVSAAAAVGGAVAEVKKVHTIVHTITATEQTTLTDASGTVPLGAVPSTSAPTVFVVEVRTGGGAKKACANVAFSFVQANANFWILQASDGGAGTTDMVNTDIVTAIVIE